MSEKVSIWDKVKVSAQLAQKQAALKNLEISGFNEIFDSLGQYAFENGLGKAPCEKQYAAIGTLDVQIAEKRKPRNLNDTATLADKAKHAAAVAKDKVVLESLLMKRKTAIRELGRAISAVDLEDPEIQKFKGRLKEVERQKEDLAKQVSALESKATGIGKRPFLVLGCAAAAIFVTYMLFFRGSAPAGANGSAEWAELKRKNEEVALKLKLEAEEAEKQRQLRAAQDDLDRQQQKLEDQRRAQKAEDEKYQREQERNQKAREREAELRKEKSAREAQAQAAAEKREQEAQARAEKARNDRLSEQESRAAYTAELFQAINIEPAFSVSKNLRALGASVELRAKNWDKIGTLYKERKWLDLINLLADRDYKEYPPASEVSVAMYKLYDYDAALVLRSPPIDRKQQGTLFFIGTTPWVKGRTGKVVTWRIVAEKHPDGIGYVVPWTPMDGPGVVVLGNYQIQRKADDFNEQFFQLDKGLLQKLKLGELSEEEFKKREREALIQVHASAIEWANGL